MLSNQNSDLIYGAENRTFTIEVAKMDKKNQELQDLILEVVKLIGMGLQKHTGSEEFQKSINEINRKMAARHGCAIGAIRLAIEIATVSVERGTGPETEAASKSFEEPAVTVRFDEKTDPITLRGLGVKIDENELEDFRRVTKGIKKGAKRAGGARKRNPAPQIPAQKPLGGSLKARGEAEPGDPRNVSQIINRIKGIARTMDLNQRRLMVKSLSKIGMLKYLGAVSLLEGAMENNVVWLQGVQSIIGKVQERGEGRGMAKEALISLERVFKLASAAKYKERPN